MIRALEEKLSIPHEIVLIPIMVILTALGAKIRIPLPFTPVPITLQVLFVLLAGSVRNGYLSQVIYIALGAAGAPFFAFGGGFNYLFGPTGGYLMAFPVAAFLINYLVDREWSFYFAALLAVMVIYLCGSIQLSIIYRLSFLTTLKLGILPFIPFDLVKALIAARLMVEITK